MLLKERRNLQQTRRQVMLPKQQNIIPIDAFLSTFLSHFDSKESASYFCFYENLE